MQFKKIVLRSCNPQKYPDLEVVCRVIENEEIGEYLESISEEDKCVAYKSAPVQARIGVEGEEIASVLTTVVDGKKYILGEEKGSVRVRDGQADIVVTNSNSTSNEQYIVKAAKFASTYERNKDGTFTPVPEERVLTRVSENVIIKTLWGSEAIALTGSFIVTYDAASNDYNVLERGAMESTYTVIPEPSVSKKKKK